MVRTRSTAFLAVGLLVAATSFVQAESALLESLGYSSSNDNYSSRRVYGDIQYLYLDTYGSEEDFNRGLSADSGFRLQGGVENCDGLGIRGRYFQFDGRQALTGGTDVDGLELNYFDIEATQTVSFCNIAGTLSAGYRHASYDAFTDDAPNNPDEALDLNGLTFGAQVERALIGNVDLFGWMQYSMLYGDDNGANDSADALMGWTEAQLGLQYNACFRGRQAVIRGGIEGQRHTGGFNDDTQDTGLVGFFVSAGLTY